MTKADQHNQHAGKEPEAVSIAEDGDLPLHVFQRRGRRALRRMTARQRALLFAMRLERTSLAELAARHGITADEVRAELSTALAILSRSVTGAWWQRWWPWWHNDADRWLAIVRSWRQGAGLMRSDLDHLPAGKQRELERVVQIIFEEFEDALNLATGWRKKARIDRIVLYGSYARGGWVDEPHTAKGYQSDYDILIMVSDKRMTDRATYWLQLEDRLNREFGITRTLKTPVNFIVHTLDEVNNGLAQGRYFFMDIARDAIALYQLADTELHEPKPKTPAEALAMAQEYFDEWFPSAAALTDGAEFYIGRDRLKEAAFSLHQAAERYYHCVLLTVTFHAPHSHNLAFLRTQAERIDPRLADVWPNANRKQRALFAKLKEAYIKARYSKHYRISAEDLAWLGERVAALGAMVELVCTERLDQLAATARKAG